MKLVSACLLGIECAWNGKSKKNGKVLELLKKGEILIPVCPEQLGGLPTPREPAEIKDCAEVYTKSGKRVTDYFYRGAKKTLEIARLYNIQEAILKEKSPSCGVNYTYDGTFSDELIAQNGITASLLQNNGIKVVSDREL